MLAMLYESKTGCAFGFAVYALRAHPRYLAYYIYSDHISTEGGHAEHVLVTRISNKMDDSSTDKQIFEFSKCPGPVEFRAAIYIVKCFRLKGIAEHVDHSTASL